MRGYIEIDSQVCKGCEVCTFFCPKKAIALSDKLNANGYRTAYFENNKDCTGCATCALVCPDVAIEVYCE
jgi:2-oxoglutarate ferredoxin oxidoreductase subunit delta